MLRTSACRSVTLVLRYSLRSRKIDSKSTRAIPFFNILWAELQELDIVIHYAHTTSKDVVRIAVIQYLVDKLHRPQVTAWIAQLMDRAYGNSQRQKRIKVLINPFGGVGSAQKWYYRDIEPIFQAAKCPLDVERTQFKGHAVEIAEKMDVDAFDVVATCSGDGLPHEVFNGLGKQAKARSALSKVAVVQLPCGTGNAMSKSVNGTMSNSLAALAVVKGVRTPLDLVSITQGDSRTLSFLSQSFGIIAEADLGTEHIRWMGDSRFLYGILIRLLRKTIWPCDLAIKVDIPKSGIREHYTSESMTRLSMEERRRKFPALEPREAEGAGLPELRYGTVNDELPEGWELVPYEKLGNFYCGNLPWMSDDAHFFPATLPHDGYWDLVTIDGDISRAAAINMLMAVDKNQFFDIPLVNYRKVSGYRLIPRQKTGYISIDGERVPWQPFQAEVHHGLGTTLTRTGHLFESVGVAPVGPSDTV